MFTLTIKKNGVITHGPSPFNTEAEAQAHFEKHKAMGTYGTPPRTEVQSFEVSPAVIAEDGTEIAPAVIEEREVKISGDFEFFIEDLTAKAEQERINTEALKFLSETDFKVIRHLDQQNLGIATSLTAEEFQELLHLRQMAREAIIK